MTNDLRLRTLGLVCVLALVGACGSSGGSGGGGGGSTVDAGSTQDSGGVKDGAGGQDTAQADTASAPDSAAVVDAGGVKDAGATQDAGSAQDAGASEEVSVTPGCPALPEGSACKGATLQTCEEGAIEETDCADIMQNLGTGVCLKVSDEWGHDCAVAEGGTCLAEGDQGLEWMFCGGDKAACVDKPDDGYCVAGVGECTDAAIGTCNGNYAVLGCAGGKSYVRDCVAYGGKCEVIAKAAACTGLPKDKLCDGVELRCATGLTCAGATADEYGACE